MTPTLSAKTPHIGYHEKPSVKKRASILHQHRTNPNYGMKGKTHSLETRAKISKARMGIKPYNYVGKETKLKKRIFYSYKYRLWRTTILERDGYTCKLCGAKNVTFEVDHCPKMYSELLRDYKIDSYEKAMDCAALWDVENGRTLCTKCHKKTGRTYVS